MDTNFPYTVEPGTVLGYRNNGQPIYPIMGASPEGDDILGGGLLGSGQEQQGGFTPLQQQQESGTSGHPAWSEYLSDIPAELHPKVTPAFEKWDRSVNEKLNQVHSTYEPWKGLVESGVDPNQAEFAVQLLNSINETPELVYQAIGDFYNLNDTQKQQLQQQGQQSQNGSIDEQGLAGQQQELNPLDPRITELERQNRILAGAMLEAQQAKLNEEADAEIDAEFAAVEQQYGKLDQPTERILVGLMQQGMSGLEAAQMYFGNLQRAGAANLPKPLILGAGGNGAPGAGIDTRKLDDAGTKNLVVQMLQAAQQQR